MKEVLDYIILNWEVTILPTLLIICGVIGVITKRTSTKKDDEILEKIEDGIHELDGIMQEVKNLKEKKASPKKDDSTAE